MRETTRENLKLVFAESRKFLRGIDPPPTFAEARHVYKDIAMGHGVIFRCTVSGSVTGLAGGFVGGAWLGPVVKADLATGEYEIE